MKTINKLNQFIKPLLQTTVSLAVLALIVGCTSDKDLTDYRTALATQDYQKIAVANGSYVGTVQSKDGSNLGTLELILKANQQPQNSQDNLGEEQKAVMTGQVQYHGWKNATVSFAQGNYTPETGQLLATMTVQDESNVATGNTDIQINGKIVNGVFTGQIYSTLYQDYAVNVTLTKDATLPQQASIDKNSERIVELNSDSMNYDAIRIDGPIVPGASTAKLSLIVAAPQSNSQQSFLRFLSPQRYVSVSIVLGENAINMSFALATINDYHPRTLTGNTSVGSTQGQTYTVSLECTEADVPNTTQKGWSCVVNTPSKHTTVLFAPRQQSSVPAALSQN